MLETSETLTCPPTKQSRGGGQGTSDKGEKVLLAMGKSLESNKKQLTMIEGKENRDVDSPKEGNGENKQKRP